MSKMFLRLWSDDSGQDIAEYAVMLAVILVLVVGTVRLIGSNANNHLHRLPVRFSSADGELLNEVLAPRECRALPFKLTGGRVSS